MPAMLFLEDEEEEEEKKSGKVRKILPKANVLTDRRKTGSADLCL